MNAELRQLIDAFRATQNIAIDFLHCRLGIPLPKTNLDWALNGHLAIRDLTDAILTAGVQLKPHGYGIDVIHPEFRIDFDYGPAGQIDCFDIWRLALHRHHLLNDTPPVGPYDDIDAWVGDALECGELTIVSETYDAFFQDPTRLRLPSDILCGG